jgi:uncharacterized Tic20 family protein
MSPDASSLATDDVQRTAALLHLSALLGLFGNGIGFVAAPLAGWLWKRDAHPALDRAGKEALNFQLTMMLAVLVSIPLCFILVGIPLLIAAATLMVVMPIVAAIRTVNGVAYRYPLTVRFVK